MEALLFSEASYAGGAVNLFFGGANNSSALRTNLVFKSPPYEGGKVRLVFGTETGSEGSGPAPDPVSLTVQAMLPAPTLAMATLFDNRLTTWRDQRVACPYQAAQKTRDSTSSGWRSAKQELGGLDLPWQHAAKSGKATDVPFAISLPTENSSVMPWAIADSVDALGSFAYQKAAAQEASAAGIWELGLPKAVSAQSLMEAATRLQDMKMGVWQIAASLGRVLNDDFGRGRALVLPTEIMPWQVARPPQAGGEVWPIVIGQIDRYVPDPNLLFQCPPLAAPWVLLFGHLPCYLSGTLSAFYILPARFYMTTNTVFAQLLPSLADVPIYAGTTISADVGSYGWTLSATGPTSLYDQLKPLPGQPKQISVTINGLPWLFAIDHPRRATSFGKDVVQITGRSVTALLGSQFARDTSRLNTAPATAQQLAALALDNTGVALDWGLEDWLVPAGAWSHAGTPLEAVQAIAAAAGGYVQSARNAATLQVRHPYPLLPGGVLGGPWNWNGAFTPDVTLAPDAIISISEDLRESPEINAVYVSGATQGVLALVKRAGSAGDLLGSQVTDALITANEAAQQRGLAILGAAGGRIMRRLELPVLTGLNQPGVLSTDQLLGISGASPWRGRVRAVSVSDSRPALRQNVLVEVA